MFGRSSFTVGRRTRSWPLGVPMMGKLQAGRLEAEQEPLVWEIVCKPDRFAGTRLNGEGNMTLRLSHGSVGDR